MGKKKYIVGFALIIFAAVLFVASNFKKSMQYYLTVDELEKTLPAVRGKEFRLSGSVVAGTIQLQQGDKPLYRFRLANGGKQLPVVYAGLVPDTFKDSSDVVVRGTF